MSYFLDVACSHLNSESFNIVVLVTFITIVCSSYYLFRRECLAICKAVATMSAIPLILMAIFATLDSNCIVPNAKSAFKEDYQIPNITCYVPRKAEMDNLLETIRPTKPYSIGYYLLDGLHGCGKSTIIQKALSPYSKSGIAHLYIQVTIMTNLADSLYEKLKLDMYCKGWWSKISSFMNMRTHACPDDPVDRIKYALNVLKQAAEQTKEEDGVPPIVVFDNLALILSMPSGLQTIHILQDYAKEMSDIQTMVILFAASESIVPNIMRSRSAISRMSGELRIGDIKDKEAVNYLTCQCPNTSSDVIQKAVQLVGGRFIHLKIASKYLPKQSGLAVLRETLFRNMETTFFKLPLEVKTVLIAVVQNILQSPTKMISRLDYECLVRELTIDQQQLIEKTNFIEIKRRVGVHFASRFVQPYFEEHLKNKEKLNFLYGLQID